MKTNQTIHLYYLIHSSGLTRPLLYNSGGYCQRGVLPLVFIPPFDKKKFFMFMKYYQVDVWKHFVEADASYLGLCCFSTKPLSSIKACFDYINSLSYPNAFDAFVIKKIDSNKKFLTNSIKEDDDILLKFD